MFMNYNDLKSSKIRESYVSINSYRIEPFRAVFSSEKNVVAK